MKALEIILNARKVCSNECHFCVWKLRVHCVKFVQLLLLLLLYNVLFKGRQSSIDFQKLKSPPTILCLHYVGNFRRQENFSDDLAIL